MNKYILAALVIVTVSAIGLLSYRFFFSGPEDAWLCENGEWIKHGNPSAPMPEARCDEKNETAITTDEETSEIEPSTGIANPASVYCVEHGGKSKIYHPQSGDLGVCVFDDGQECEEWAFYRGECKPLAQQELQTQEQNGDNMVQISNVNMLRSALQFIKTLCGGNYPTTLQDIANDSICDGGAPIAEVPKDSFTGKNYVYTSSGDDYELKYFLDLSNGESTISGQKYNDGWNIATKDYLSREGGH